MENNELTYTEASARLDELVAKMQSPDCSIDELSDYTKQALELLKLCKSRLTATDEQLKQVLAQLGDAPAAE